MPLKGMNNPLNRRDFIGNATVLATASAAALMTGVAFAADSNKDHAHHPGHSGMTPALGPKEATLLHASSDCYTKAELCQQHCLDMMATGDTTLAACAQSVREILIYCDALTKATARRSVHVKELARIAAQACDDCEKECHKHEDMAVCKSCGDACVECSKACKAILA